MSGTSQQIRSGRGDQDQIRTLPKPHVKYLRHVGEQPVMYR
jgi:hypothetical protein